MTEQRVYLPSPRDHVRRQIEEYESSGGQRGNRGQTSGQPVVVVTMRGRRTGAIRKCVVIRVEHGGKYALVGSFGGRAHDPAWCHNLRAHPEEVRLQDGETIHDVHVEELSGPLRDEWWNRAVAIFPEYARYQEDTARQIPVFLAAPRTTGS